MAESKESNVDVLIIGAGPAGLMATLWMSRLGVNTRTVDKRGTRVLNGQADGLQCRTMEIFDSFGFASKVIDTAMPFHEMVGWAPNEETGFIERKNRFPALSAEMSNFKQYVMHQGYVEKFILESIHEHSDLVIERGVLPSAISIDETKAQDPDAYPVTVTLQHLAAEDAKPHQIKAHMKSGEVSDGIFRSNLAGDDTPHLIEKAVSKGEFSEVVHAKYVIAGDGAHSWTRQQLGFEMKGENTDYIWGVIDIIPTTNYPDIRRPGTVQSEKGSILIIPRENKIVRFYTQLHEVKANETGYVDRSKITPELILKTTQNILAPYKLDYSYCDWWTAYQVGQRVGTGFCDANQRVFLAGDAVHTHSPKAGQGMNVSMQDTNNLAWKVGGVVNGWLPRDILETYQPERRKFAHQLIEFDHKLSRMFSGSPTRDELLNMYSLNKVFVSGYAVHYAPSSTIATYIESSTMEPADPLRDQSGTPVRQSLVKAKKQYAKNLTPGRVIRSGSILGHADSAAWDIKSCLKSDGRWRLFVFAGNVADPAQMGKIDEIGARLTTPGGLLSRYLVKRQRPTKLGRPPGPWTKVESLVDVITIHSSKVDEIEVTAFHAAFLPLDEYDGYQYDKIYSDMDYNGITDGNTYDLFGVDRKEGALIVTRPDQHVALITSLDDLRDVETFFDGVLVRQDTETLLMNQGARENGTAHVNGAATTASA